MRCGSGSRAMSVRVDALMQQPAGIALRGAPAPDLPTGEPLGREQAAHDGRPRLWASAPEVLDFAGTTLSCRRGQELYRQSDAADAWYRVVSGLAKEQALMPDGRHQIVDFLLPGDFFGFGSYDRHQFAVEAVLNGTVLVCYPRREIEMLAERDPSIAMLIYHLAIATMSRSQARTLTLGRTRAPQKVGAFLLEMAERMADQHADTVTLQMSRYDIADYLGLSVEAVSRAITRLKCRGIIRLTSTRRVRILNPEALALG
jgi:CRP-like cAMP-binding protein